MLATANIVYCRIQDLQYSGVARTQGRSQLHRAKPCGAVRQGLNQNDTEIIQLK